MSTSFVHAFTEEISKNLESEHLLRFKKYVAETAMSVEKGRLTISTKYWLERIGRSEIDYYDNVEKWIDFIHTHSHDVPHSFMFTFICLSAHQTKAGPCYLKLLTEMVVSRGVIEHIDYQLDEEVEERAGTRGYPSEGAIQLVMRSVKERVLGTTEEEATLIRELFVRLTVHRRIVDTLRRRKELRDDIMSLESVLGIDLSVVRERVYVL